MFKPAEILSAFEILRKTLSLIWESEICHDSQGLDLLGGEKGPKHLRPPD